MQRHILFEPLWEGKGQSILLINPKIFNSSHWLPLHDLDVRLRTVQSYSHILKTRPRQRHLPIACIFAVWPQSKEEERHRSNKWWAQELVMSTMTVTPSNLREVCRHIWILISHVLSCTLQSKPRALHSLSRDNQKQHDEFMSKKMQGCNMIPYNNMTTTWQRRKRELLGEYKRIQEAVICLNWIRSHRKGRDEEHHFVPLKPVQLTAAAADVEWGSKWTVEHRWLLNSSAQKATVVFQREV